MLGTTNIITNQKTLSDLSITLNGITTTYNGSRPVEITIDAASIEAANMPTETIGEVMDDMATAEYVMYDRISGKLLRSIYNTYDLATDHHAHSNFDELPTGLSTGYITSGKNSDTTLGLKATCEGLDCEASGDYSHATGSQCKAIGECSFASGFQSIASGFWSTATSAGSIASGTEAFASRCGYATGESSASIGYLGYARGLRSTLLGSYGEANGEDSTACGYETIADGYSQFVIGSRNKPDTTSVFIIGNGLWAENDLSNAFRVDRSGQVYAAGNFNSSGADYGEYFEWFDGNPNKEDRIGLFVALDEDKIVLASSPDDYIIGAISGTASIVGNAQDDQWGGTFVKDEFGRDKREIRTITHNLRRELTEEEVAIHGPFIPRTETGLFRIPNPDFDASLTYVPRSERPEWDIVGMFGVLTVRDDGTCQPNSYCQVTTGGIATASTEGYRVMKRISDNVIKVLFRGK